jgi:hypothetical protein
MWWPFRRKSKPKPLPHMGPASVDWVPGDIAECVSDRWNPKAVAIAGVLPPKIGDRLMVRQVQYGIDLTGCYTGFGLWFIGRGGIGYDAGNFRKIVLADTGADRKVARSRPLEPVQ